MNPFTPHPISPQSMLKNIWMHRQLITQMAWQEVNARYKGSVLGLFWSFANPLLMLAVYTVVFSVVFKARWGGRDDETQTSFALVLFVGLIMHGLLAEVLNRSPTLILTNVNYVKKVIFPIEILPVVVLMSSLFYSAASLVVFAVAFIALNGLLPWTAIFIPVVMLPLVVLSLGLAWILASLGVFLRDIGHTIGIVTTVMLFMSTVFFPLSALPVSLRPFITANPITFIIDQAREVLIFGNIPNFTGLAFYMLIALVVLWMGYVLFQKTRKGFSDVL